MLFPLPPNWKRPVQVTPAFRTDIVTSRSGREQRRALRRTPRLTLNFTVTVAADERRQLTALLRRHQNQTTTLADPTRQFRAGEPAPDWYISGRAIVVNSNTVAVVGGALPDGALVQPALIGRLSGTVTASHASSRAAEANITFAVDPGSEPADDSAAGLYAAGGREALVARPNWKEALSQEFDWPVEQVDYGFGRVATYTPITEGWFTQQVTFTGDTGDVRQLFARMRGRRGEFLMPTDTDDLSLTASSPADSTVLQVEGDVELDYSAIAIRLWDGRLVLRTVTAAAPVGDTTTLTIGIPLSFDLHPSDIAMISWMPVFRFASDESTTEWLTTEASQVQMAMRSLPALPVDDPIPDYDGAAQYVLEAWGDTGALLDFDYAVNVAYPALFFWPEAWVQWADKPLATLERTLDALR